MSSLAKPIICGVPPKKLNNDTLPIANGFWKEIKGYFCVEETKEEGVAGIEIEPSKAAYLLLSKDPHSMDLVPSVTKITAHC